MNKLAAIALTLSACAATTGLPVSESARPPALTFGAPSDEAKSTFPTRISEERLPTADRMRDALRATGHEKLTAQVRLCIAPDGTTSSVQLDKTTGVADLDSAIVHDIGEWRYESYVAPASIRVCKPVTLTYAP